MSANLRTRDVNKRRKVSGYSHRGYNRARSRLLVPYKESLGQYHTAAGNGPIHCVLQTCIVHRDHVLDSFVSYVWNSMLMN